MSIVVDKLSTFKPGTEIFTMAVGPQSSGNQVFFNNREDDLFLFENYY